MRRMVVGSLDYDKRFNALTYDHRAIEGEVGSQDGEGR